MKIFITLGDLIEIGILALIIIISIIYVIVKLIGGIGKKNCYNCKYYDLYDVTSVGGYCRMKCKKHNRVDKKTDINESKHLEKCNEFEVK